MGPRIWVLAACLAAGRAAAHESSFALDRELVATVWDTRDGLPQASATAMDQSADGYLWFGTFAGVVRFDGRRFEVFDRTRSLHLPSNAVIRVFIDRRGWIWMGTDRGVAFMEGEEVRPFPDVDLRPSGMVESIVEDASGRILVSADRKITALDAGARRAKLLDTPGRGDESSLDQLTLVASQGQVYAERGREIYELDEADQWIKVAEMPTNVLAMSEKRGAGLWISTQEAIFSLRNGGSPERVFRHASPLPEDYGTLFETSSGEVWTTSHVHGVMRYRAGEPVVHYTRDNGFAHDSTRFVFEDEQQNLWVGTDGAGLVRLRRSAFRTLSGADGLGTKIVRGVLEEGERRWLVATWGGGVVRFDGGRFGEPIATTDRAVSPVWAHAMLRARDGAVWIGFHRDGVSRLGSNGSILRPVFPTRDAPTARVLAQDASGLIYIGTDAGLYQTAADGRGVVEEILLDGTARTRVLALLARADGLWVGTEERGLWKLSGGTSVPVEPLARDSREITALTEDSRGAVWAALDGGSLYRFAGERTIALGEADGLPHARYREMIDDGHGRLWLASNQGAFSLELARFERYVSGADRQLVYDQFDGDAGLPNRELNGVSLLKNGDLVFSTLSGLAVLTPSALRERVMPAPRVRFEVLYVADAEGAARRIAAAPAQLALAPGPSSIELHFTAPSFVAAERMRFELEIEGPNLSSVHRLERRSFELLHPAAGDYHLKLSAIDAAGLRSPQPAILTLKVLPHFWQTWWFSGGMSALVLAASGYGVSLRYRRRLARAHDRVEQETLLRLSEERQRELFETAQALIWFLDDEGRFRMVTRSAEQIYGRRPEDVVGLPFTFASTDEAADRAFIERLRDATDSLDHTAVHRRADQREVHLRFKAVPRRDAEGRVTGFAGTAMDVTEEQLARSDRERVERKMKEAQRLESLGVLAGGVSHDFNNLLAAVLLNVDYLKECPVPDPEALQAVAAIEAAARRATELCRQMLAYSGRGRFQLKALNLHALAESSANLVRTSAPKDVRFEFDFCSHPPIVFADEAQLGQVVVNLLSNGAEAIGSGSGRVVTRTRVVEGEPSLFDDAILTPKNARQKFLVLSATDDGCGMSPDTVARIFDPFFSTKSTGRGLGLAAVLGIVRGHEGALSVKSQIGRGSTFEVWLPATEASLNSGDIQPVLAKTYARPLAALVVDDEEPIRNALSRILSRRGVSVAHAVNGQDALEHFQPGLFDVVFMDVSMPVMTGVDALAVIRARALEQRVVMMSGYSVEDIACDPAMQGVFGFLGKPFRVEEIDKILDTVRSA